MNPKSWRRIFSERALENAGGSVTVKVEGKVIFMAKVENKLYGCTQHRSHARYILGSR